MVVGSAEREEQGEGEGEEELQLLLLPPWFCSGSFGLPLALDWRSIPFVLPSGFLRRCLVHIWVCDDQSTWHDLMDMIQRVANQHWEYETIIIGC